MTEIVNTFGDKTKPVHQDYEDDQHTLNVKSTMLAKIIGFLHELEHYTDEPLAEFENVVPLNSSNMYRVVQKYYLDMKIQMRRSGRPSGGNRKNPKSKFNHPYHFGQI